jgi:hypothetical protein
MYGNSILMEYVWKLILLEYVWKLILLECVWKLVLLGDVRKQNSSGIYMETQFLWNMYEN